MATKTTRYFTVIAILMTTLSLFSPFSAMASSGETTTSSSGTTTTTIVTNQDASSENGMSSIIDKTQDLTQSGIGSMVEDTEEGVDNLISSTTTNTTTPVQLSGKIASSRINLNNGNVEQVLFGDWSVNVRSFGDSSFAADFSARSSNSSNNEEGAHYRIDNLKLNSIQRQNENIALGGTVDVTEEKGARTWAETPVTILLVNDSAMVIRFEQQELNEVFSNQPIIGVAVPSQ